MRDPDYEEEEKPKIIQKRVKTHGAQWPFHPFQIASWIILGVNLALVIGLLTPVSWEVVHWAYSITFLVLYLLATTLVIYFCARATLTDPTD